MVVANWLGNENGISVFAVCADDQVQAAVANGQSSETPVDGISTIKDRRVCWSGYYEPTFR